MAAWRLAARPLRRNPSDKCKDRLLFLVSSRQERIHVLPLSGLRSHLFRRVGAIRQLNLGSSQGAPRQLNKVRRAGTSSIVFHGHREGGAMDLATAVRRALGWIVTLSFP